MTFSIVARSADGRHFGVAVASKFLAVGAMVPAAAVSRGERRGGALATQALANLSYKADGLRLLAEGTTAKETVQRLTSADEMAAHRQLGVVDADGQAATFTGPECLPWAGGAIGYGYAIQGNILAGSRVVALMEEAWLASDPRGPLSHRLLAALAAGDAAGGDSRGKQSAALLVVAPGEGYDGSDVLVDLRVDDHDEPVAQLGRLLALHDLLFGRSAPEMLLALEGELVAEVSRLLSQRGFVGEVGQALAAWGGRENLEMRLVEGKIDPVVLDYLRTGSGGL
ncbi:DUF1028 domain-containing protein [Actinocrinis puniceicyclus]|uniref:DUF1028 domain-containing protein n=1 Tax=Actinocrinis puniceicyclus TaxID=977794 RepID=A0A8J8BG01_9ACTN|nr:DUF1028 domain-containing protein [Actinocrinis puniceicyclus]MBS2965229.1 DUF1028 domain-containing protein [Actinocrinis puniceicyclus]